MMGQVAPYIGADLLVLASLQDSVRHGELGQIPGLDLEALEAKVRSLDPLEALAVLDAVEIYWAAPPEPGEREARWRELGLLPPEGARGRST